MKKHHLNNRVHIAIIGGQGLIGKHLIYRLANQPNVRITAPDLDHYAGFKDLDKFKAIVEQPIINFRTYTQASNFIATTEVDYIIYCAGFESPTDGLYSSYIDEVHTLPALANVLDSLPQSPYIGGEKDPPYFMYISSWSVYGTNLDRPHIEEDTLVPANYSGMIKMASEDLVHRACTKFGIKYSIIRPTEIYGKWNFNQVRDQKHWYGYLNYYIDKIIKRENAIDIFSPDTKVDLVNINYVTKVILHLLVNNITGIYNISSGNYYTLAELANKVKQAYGLQSPSMFEVSSILEIEHMILNNSKINSMVPYDNQKYNLDKFLEEYIPIRRLEIAKQKTIEQIFSEKTLFDTTAFAAKEAYIERMKKRKIAYKEIKDIAGPEFSKIKYARITERIQEVLENKEPKVIITDTAPNKDKLLQSMKELEILDLNTKSKELEFSDKKENKKVRTRKRSTTKKRKLKLLNEDV